MSLSRLSNQPIRSLKGVGPKIAEKLTRINLHSVEDLLFHLPLRYEDRTHITAIADAHPNEFVVLVANVVSSQIVMARKRILNVRIEDGSGVATLKFFAFSAAQKNHFSAGTQLKIWGEIKRGREGLEMIHPEYKDWHDDQVEETFTPVYPTTEGLKQSSLRQLTEQALSRLDSTQLDEIIPSAQLPNTITLKDALKTLHRPPPETSLSQLELGQHPAQQRLAFEELVAHNLSMQKIRQAIQRHQAPPLRIKVSLMEQFLAQLPFQPTQAQWRVSHEIQQDLAQNYPMMRLVQGDVGSGKTLVAALAALTALSQGQQVALMAPTEILAEQHAISFSKWFAPLGISVDWLVGRLTSKQKKQAAERIASGQSQMVIGTHALFQAQVEFKSLALIIIDEQHRFGVHQRMSLREKGIANESYPHQLIMTATPIPRTLAMTAYADLKTSVIDELPPGRTQIQTLVLPDTRRAQVIERVADVCKHQKRQAYWVCTLIEESEALQCQAAEDTAMLLQEQLPDLSIGLIHGRMKALEKQQVMDEFKAARMDLLVATTVIEVGVDVPNASLMIIENPERLGLAQLHQLRGRVGRGSVASHCLLMYKTPLSDTGHKRLAVMRESSDGFYIAQKDLEIRGPGELLGTRQTGEMHFKIADLMRDQGLIEAARDCAEHIIKSSPEQTDPLIERWITPHSEYTQA